MTAIPTEIRAEIDKLERKHAENPGGRYFVPLASAYRRAGIVNRAITVLGQGIAHHPEYLSARIVLGRCYADQGKIEAARGEFSQVLSADPHNLVALRTLGELAVAAGNPRDARSWYEQLLAVDPMNEEARIALDSLERVATPSVADGRGSGSMGAVASMVVEVAPGSSADPTEATTEFVIPDIPSSGDDTGLPIAPIRVAGSKGDADVGIPTPREAVDYEGEEILITETLAELYTRQGFFDRAIHVYRELIRRHGDDPRLHDRLSRVERLAAGGADSADEAAPTALSGDGSSDTGLAADSGTPARSAPGGSSGSSSGTGIQDYLTRLLSWHEDPSDDAGSGSGAYANADVEDGAGLGETVHELGAPTTEGAGAAPIIESGEARVDLPPLAFSEDEVGTGTSEAVASGEPDLAVEASAADSAERPAGSISELEEADPAGERSSTVEYVPPSWGPAGAVTPPAASEDELFPWEVPLGGDAGHADASVPAESSVPLPTPDAPTASRDVEGSVDSGDADFAASAEVEATTDSFESLIPVAPDDEAAAGPEGENDDEDDDIESFQAWLRGLKR